MFCPDCGANVPDSSKFCPKCGAELNAAEEKSTYETFDQNKTGREKIQTQSNGQDDEIDERTLHRYHMQMRIGIIAAVVVAIGVVIVIVVMLNNRTTTIDLNNYLVITIEGDDGNGTASYYIDEQQLWKDYGNKIHLTNSHTRNNVLANIDEDYRMKLFLDCISGSFDKSSGLSNGDEITFRWEIDTSALAEFEAVKIKYSDISRTVIGLKE